MFPVGFLKAVIVALAPRWLGLHAPRGLRGLGSGLGTAGRGLEERQERSEIDMMVVVMLLQ